MLSGLYGDLPEAKSNAAATATSSGGWAAKPKFAPPARKPALAPPRSVLGSAKKRSSDRDGSQSHEASPAPASSVPLPGVLGGSQPADRLVDEYDPARPNEYEAVRKEREKLKQDAEQEAVRQQELQIAKVREAEEEVSQPEISAEEHQAALSLSGEEAFLRRARLGKPGSRAAEAAAAEGGSTFAQRMMEKMGWKEGLGLGKAHQGITSPLMAQKTDHRSAVIVNASLKAAESAEDDGPPAEKRHKGVSIQGSPSRVVLLRNIVGPGEVDDSLEDEIGEECSKYGQISYITIFEVTEANYPPEQAVRIFVQFDRMESAMKALIDLEGRFFGGRTVKATFFSEQRFEKQELAPLPGQED